MGSSNDSGITSRFVVTPRTSIGLDFANTVAWRGSTPAENLHNFADLIKWCGDAGLISPRIVYRARKWPDKHPKRSVEVFGEAIALREVIYRVFHTVASGSNPNVGDLDSLNRALSDAPRRTSLQRTDSGFGWEVPESKISASSLLAPVLWSTGDLLVGPQLARVRECSNDKCLWLFLDDSKNGTRRWCSMQACGNRAKAHRHYLRQKQG
jgi:predicted RNA-binding Zn ribbon-like protein